MENDKIGNGKGCKGRIKGDVMRLLMFGMTQEEKELALEYKKVSPGLTLEFMDGILELSNMDCVKGFDGVSILTNSQIGYEEAQQLHANGIKYVTTRSTGADHLDKTALRHFGIKAANVPSYSPNAISEHTILLFLAALRNLKRSLSMTEHLDYGIDGLRGREIRMMTVGVIGAGRIGALTVKALNGLGAKVLVHALHKREDVSEIADYVTLEELFEKSDAILLHCPLTEENYHMINEEALSKCKDNLVLVNTARGGLVDGAAVLQALESGKIQSFAMDVYETENSFVRKSFEKQEFPDPLFTKLCGREDVIYTSHIGFLTDQACKEMIKITMENIEEYRSRNNCKNEVVF